MFEEKIRHIFSKAEKVHSGFEIRKEGFTIGDSKFEI